MLLGHVPHSTAAQGCLRRLLGCVQVLLRELSRDVLEAVRVLFGSTSFPTIPPDRMQLLSASSPNAFGPVQRLRAANLRAAAAAAEDAPVDAPGDKSPYGSVPWDQTVAHALLAVRRLRALPLHACAA
jgi:hypothetical protein